LTTFTQCQKGGLAVQVIVFHVACHVMARNQIQKFLVGTENKIFMMLEELWQYEHGLMTI
jgi:methylthioribose-1-phosphate isomerase